MRLDQAQLRQEVNVRQIDVLMDEFLHFLLEFGLLDLANMLR